MQLVCAHCLSVNRVPPDRMADAPKCGKCKRLLLAAIPHELSSSGLTKFVQRSDLPVLVDFWAGWCGPCRMMAPAFAEACSKCVGRVVFAKFDTEADSEAAAAHRISSLPTIVLFKSGSELARQSGALNASQILRWVDAHIH